MKRIKTPLGEYLTKIYRARINQLGEVITQKQFALWLGLEYSSWNRYYNGSRRDMDYFTALGVCEKLNDYELLEVLGYPRPLVPFDVAALPPDEFEGLSSALTEIVENLKVSADLSDEAWIGKVEEILGRHNWARSKESVTQAPDGE